MPLTPRFHFRGRQARAIFPLAVHPVERPRNERVPRLAGPRTGALLPRPLRQGGDLRRLHLGIFLYGIYLGSSRDAGVGRVVYCSFRSADLRLYYFCPAGAGLPALPAIIQYIRVNNGRAPLQASKFEAPPRDDAELNALNFDLGRTFELGTLYTSIAGLLNLLAAYDACAGR